jgi:hypothetical protein
VSHLRIKRTAQGNRFYRAAVEQLPGYARAWRVAETAQARLDALPVAVELPSPLEAGEITDEWLDAAVSAELAANATDCRRRILVQQRDSAHRVVASVVDIGTDAALESVHGALTRVLDAGREICGRLDAARTPAQAIAAGRESSAAWGELPGVVAEYRQVRAAQSAFMVNRVDVVQAARSNDNGDSRCSDLLLRNLDEVAPDWRQPPLDHFAGGSLWTPPWPADETEYLVWLVTSRAQAWVPTCAQLEQQRHERPKAKGRTAPSTVRKNGMVNVLNRSTGVSA